MIVFSLGGSIMVPDVPHRAYLSAFKRFIQKISKKERVAIITGGGKTARSYINALEGVASKDNQDNIGIKATEINALLLIYFLGLNQKLPSTIGEASKIAFKSRISVFGGLKIGQTSDAVAAELAAETGARLFINMTNVNGLFNKDPTRFKDARLIRKISFDGLISRIRKFKEKPGQHFILDSKASQIIKKNNIRTLIVQGRNLKNIERAINNKRFIGTTISD
jgi:uridylate kinase